MSNGTPPIDFEQFPGLVTNPPSEEIGPAVSENLLNVVAIDAGQGRVRGGLEEFNTANWNAGTGNKLTVRAQNPPADSVDVIIFVVQDGTADQAEEAIGMYPFTPRASGGNPFTGGGGEQS